MGLSNALDALYRTESKAQHTKIIMYKNVNIIYIFMKFFGICFH